MIPLFVGPWAYVSCKPRASGDDPYGPSHYPWSSRVNPARAGMIRASGRLRTSSGCKPRASGDDPLWRKRLIHILAVNPARAGMILSPPIWSSHRAGKPRASGDDPPDQQANFDKSK